MIKVSAPDRAQILSFFVLIVSTKRHYADKKCTGIITPYAKNAHIYKPPAGLTDKRSLSSELDKLLS